MGSLRDAQCEEAQAQGDCVGAHVARIAEEGERSGEPAADDFKAGRARSEPYRSAQPSMEAHARCVDVRLHAGQRIERGTINLGRG